MGGAAIREGKLKVVPPTPKIFRQVSLERLSSPEQLDQLMKITRPHSWAALAALGFVLLAAVLWATFATVPVTVAGRGIIVRGTTMHEVFAPRTGLMREVLVKVGDSISPGQVVARMSYAEEEARIRQAKAVVGTLQADKSPMTPDRQKRIEEAQRNVAVLEAAYDAESAVVTPFTGKVVDILADSWDLIAANTHIIYVEPTDRPIEALVYLSPADGGRVKAGMEVQLSPVTVRQEEYGCMLGNVVSVALFPSSTADLQRKFDNQQLVSELSAGRSPLLVNVSLQRDARTPSGFAWSSPKGPPYPVQIGTICSASVIVRRQRPIAFILPMGFLGSPSGLVPAVH